ncbi:MAG: GvpL/GvpF family gas vesicle protein [Methylococcaceae bacterium]
MKVSYFIYATIDNSSAIPSLAEFQAGGINAAPLEMVCYRDIAAVVSAIDVNFSLGEASTEQEENHQAHLLSYQQVNEFLLKKADIIGMLPLKFGFTASSHQDVEKVLEQAYIQLRTYLDKLKGTMELVIQVSWELPQILQSIIKDNPELASADPLQTGRLLFEAAELKKRNFVAAIHRHLSPCSKDYSDAPLKTEAMIFNRSYLVEKDKESLFDDAVDLVATEFEELLMFRYIGPLPAYSFVNIELNQGNFAMVDNARKTLQLPEKASWETIKSAYRQLILAHHPDRNPDNPQAVQATKAVIEAYDIVKAYCHSLSEFGEPNSSNEISFAKEVVEQAFIVDTKGAVLARTNTPKNPA